MRMAVISDVHGNLGALEAVLIDLRELSPDVVVHGGDLADAGSSPCAVVDRVRELGIPSILGNTDEMLARPETLDAFAAQSAAPKELWDSTRANADATRAQLGADRVAWLRELPRQWEGPDTVVIHASPKDCWRVPREIAWDAIFASTGAAMVVFGHTHLPFVRVEGQQGQVLVNSGSVGLPYDGDPRASYAVLEDGRAWIRRVAYDVEAEIGRLRRSGLAGAAWTERMLRAAGPVVP